MGQEEHKLLLNRSWLVACARSSHIITSVPNTVADAEFYLKLVVSLEIPLIKLIFYLKLYSKKLCQVVDGASAVNLPELLKVAVARQGWTAGGRSAGNPRWPMSTSSRRRRPSGPGAPPCMTGAFKRHLHSHSMLLAPNGWWSINKYYLLDTTSDQSFFRKIEVRTSYGRRVTVLGASVLTLDRVLAGWWLVHWTDESAGPRYEIIDGCRRSRGARWCFCGREFVVSYAYLLLCNCCVN